MYKSLQDACNDLEKTGQLLRIKSEVDGYLEVSEIHRRIFENHGPAILFENIKGTKFRGLSNLYGTFERTDFLFRRTQDKLRKLIELKADPSHFLKNPLRYISTPFTAFKALPSKRIFSKPVMYSETRIDQLPLIHAWPEDGGAFVTMPQVLTLPPGGKNIMEANVGMYRIQLTGNDYELNKEIGLHYQLHRGIGVHHTQYNESNEEFRCSVFIGGPPSHAFAAIMPMPEGISELTFAGMLGGRRFGYFFDPHQNVISADADFVITGTIEKNTKKPEGPFGDHLGYYSLTHDFPVMKVNKVYHRQDAIWHFTVVGRPPMEDSSFGYLIHKLVGNMLPKEFPGLVDLNAVDAAGVHPLLLATAKERYMPFRDKVPEEILTIGSRILGSGQTSLAKYLLITDVSDHPEINPNNIESYVIHFLSRVKWDRDLHFTTKTTIDTLDYSGSSWNSGSKVLMACRGSVIRKLSHEPPSINNSLPHVQDLCVVLPGVLAFKMNKFKDYESTKIELQTLTAAMNQEDFNGFPLIVLCDDARFVAETLNNFLWVTFTRSNPSHDIYGVNAFTEYKHWGCHGSLIIDARIKPHHAPELVPDADTVRKVDKLFSKGGELYNVLK